MRLNRSGQFTGYRDNTYRQMQNLLKPLAQLDSAVDVGCGEGWFANRLMQDGIVKNCIAVEVSRRKHLDIEPIIYDGKTLPFPDNYTTLAYSVDVIHHAENPLELLKEIARISSTWILLKDHTFNSLLGQLTLQILDQLGNRRFGIDSPGKYQRAWLWLDYLESLGFTVAALVYPATSHSGLLGLATNSLQFMALLQKKTC